VETGTVVAEVPAPLGWRSQCLGERGQERQAVTLYAGTALCRADNEAAHRGEQEQRDQVGALAAQAEQQLRGLLGGDPSAGPGPGRVGF
jgi:hypothetical protein